MAAQRQRTGQLAAAWVVVALLAAGCSQSRESPLPDLATQSPSKQPVMTPQDQKKAIDAMVAKREAQAAETTRSTTTK